MSICRNNCGLIFLADVLAGANAGHPSSQVQQIRASTHSQSVSESRVDQHIFLRELCSAIASEPGCPSATGAFSCTDPVAPASDPTTVSATTVSAGQG